MSNRIIRAYAGRINIYCQPAYQVLADIRTVKVIGIWTHYE